MAGLYIHIPFCASRCIYCGFYSTTNVGLQDKYVNSICQEMTIRPERPNISTIYFGGGTPSQLSYKNFVKLFDHISRTYTVDTNAEITVECNPDDINEQTFNHLPVNRVSMGAQSFSDVRLRFLCRRHTATEVEQAVTHLRQQGINNISIDLMFGFPDETMTDWEQNLRRALKLDVEHISAYGLMYEEGTPLYKLWQANKVKEIDENLSLAMYDKLVSALTSAGYEHYEISNFAKLGFRSKHNSAYWHGIPYIGIGAAAHSYDQSTRSWNVSDIRRYIDSIEKGILPMEIERLDEETKYNDVVTTALRTREGINLDTLAPRYKNYLLEAGKDYISRGLLVLEDNSLHLSMAGINISNTIMSDLMWV